MPTAREIQRRINSVQNINQVTHALEAVSASAVRRAQNAAMSSRPYAQYAYEVLVNVAAQSRGTPLHPLLEVRPDVKRIAVVLITGDRGLAGAYNTNIVRRAMTFVEQYERPVHWVTVGRKGRDLVRRWIARQRANPDAPAYLKQQTIVAEFSNLPAGPDLEDVAPIAQTIFEEFLNHTVDEVFIAYTQFVNTMTQRPQVLHLLPLKPFEPSSRAILDLVQASPEVHNAHRVYTYEPSAEAILQEVLPRFTELQILQALRESLSSEHSARMVAMRNASSSAETLSEMLTLEYNKARQLAITSEILDIIGGVEALDQKG
ncbi:MAG TPA: ATP synthase F1 subunit gamma [Aggregatilinea sp.]|jgi:F-type H+-transporting ATPase subunit gamma|uniref:ATP synthase F1 subunit gamma n=1 Tax=Aggregatilinea sp. TaxID=2806333 RepID=UPI002BA55F2D|nr:ATP synthase F1 subunit gamma [Aggregatilinea sp.]HML21674.1 ATP synthase F1 subunit gamma [Aggregatilinea sp.]